MKKILAVLMMLTLIVSCLSTAFAEEGASAAEATEPTSHILVVYFSATGTTKGVAEKLAVFFTSGGSGLGSSMKHLEEQAGAGTWLEGKRFSSRTTVEELTGWAASLGIEP